MLTLTPLKPTALTQEDARFTELELTDLAGLLHDQGKTGSAFQNAPLRLSVERLDGEKAELAIPNAALPILVSLLTELSQGKSVAVVTTDTEITTQQAADFMNVSRPYVVKLVDQGKMPSRKVGVRRRVRLADVLHYMEESGNVASQAFDELAAENQRLGLYP